MGKITTALRLLRGNSLGKFCQQVKLSYRRGQLSRNAERPFAYKLAGTNFVCFPDLPDSCELFLKRDLDDVEDNILKQWLRPGDLVVDVGANVGIYTWRAHHFLRGEGKFLAVEASNRICSYLSRATELTRVNNIDVCNYAIGDEEREVEFYEAPPGRFSVEQSLIVDADRTHMIPVNTRMTTIGSLVNSCAQGAVPALIKVDVEGAEVMALSGALPEWFMAVGGPLWIVEVNSHALARFDATPQQILDFFPADKFRRVLLPKFPVDGERSGSSRVCRSDERFADALFYNLVAIPISAERNLSLKAAPVK